MKIASFRKMTPAMLRSQRLAMANDIVKTTKAQVAMALKKAAPKLGIEGTTYHILDILIGLTKADDWQQHRKPLVAISNEKLAEYVGRSKRTVVRCIKRLVESGILAYQDSSTGRRFIYRDDKGDEILKGYGLDFSPARQRVRELQKMGQEFAAKIARDKEVKRTIVQLSRTIVDLSQLAKAQAPEIRQTVEKVLNEPNSNETKLEALRTLHEALLDQLDEHIESPAGDIHDTPYNNTTLQDSSSCKEVRNSSNDEYSQLKKPSGFEKAFDEKSIRKSSANSKRQKQNSSLEDVSVGLIASATPETQKQLDFSVRTWSDVVTAIPPLALMLGLSEAGVEDCRRKCGDLVLGAVLMTTVEKALRDPGTVSNPAGYVRACVDKAMNGKLVLHRSLFGLLH